MATFGWRFATSQVFSSESEHRGRSRGRSGGESPAGAIRKAADFRWIAVAWDLLDEGGSVTVERQRTGRIPP